MLSAAEILKHIGLPTSETTYPVIVQLVGNDPYLFSEAAKLAADLGAYSLDINMGCPVKKVVGNGSGSA